MRKSKRGSLAEFFASSPLRDSGLQVERDEKHAAGERALPNAPTVRTWQVLLLSGASGVGKSSVSYRLARMYDVGIVEADDIQVAVERMTTPEQQPVLHFWRTNPDAFLRLDEEQKLEHMRRHAAALAPALDGVIANHLETRTPIVLEGDFLLPALAVQPTYEDIAADGRVSAVFLYEEDEGQLRQNFLQREGEEQPGRARSAWLHSEWLRAECARLGVAAVRARPWDTVLERVIAAAAAHDREGKTVRG